MKTHVDHGLEIVQRSDWLGDATGVVCSHHEKFDGSGYPHGLTAKDIPIEARIIAVADIFDALTTDRPYRLSKSRDETFSILKHEAEEGKLDDSIVDCMKIIGRQN